MVAAEQRGKTTVRKEDKRTADDSSCCLPRGPGFQELGKGERGEQRVKGGGKAGKGKGKRGMTALTNKPSFGSTYLRQPERNEYEDQGGGGETLSGRGQLRHWFGLPRRALNPLAVENTHWHQRQGASPTKGGRGGEKVQGRGADEPSASMDSPRARGGPRKKAR